MTDIKVEPKNTCAIIVGVEKYDPVFAPPLKGPAKDARRFADWLVSRGVHQENIALLISPLDHNTYLLENWSGSYKGSATRQNVSEVLTKGLNHWSKKLGLETDPQSKGLLFLFWAGHGITTEDKVRRLFYTDTTEHDNYHLNLDRLLKHLDTPYISFQQQIVVVDTCADYKPGFPRLVGDTFREAESVGHRQFIFFASKQGQEAKNNSEEETGYFSDILLQELAQEPSNSWPPNMDEVASRVQARFVTLPSSSSAFGQVPNYVDYDNGYRQYTLFRKSNEVAPQLDRVLDSALQRELRDLADRLTAFRLLDSHWIEEMQQSEENLRFYDGFRATWSDLTRSLDVSRDQFPELLKLAKRSAGYRVLIAIISEMGSGKTTILKRLALELYSEGSIVLYHKETASALLADEIRQLANELKHRNALHPIYLCIDDAARTTNLSEFVSQLAEDGIKATLLVASRTSEWRDANLALTANLDYDPLEFPLFEHLSSREVEELTLKLQLHGRRSKPLNLDSEKSFLVVMMEATKGRGFREIIKERIRHFRKKTNILLSVYEYTCLLGQFGLPMPLSVLEALFPKNDILTDVLSQPLFRDVIQFTEDKRQITPGHELVAQSVIEQQYGTGPTGHIVLAEMFTRLIHSVPSELSPLTMSLLLTLGGRNKPLANKIIARSEQLLAELVQKSSAEDLSRGWARVYERVDDYESAQKCYLRSLEISENSHNLAHYATFLRDRNQFREAKRHMERAVAIAPNDSIAHSMLGQLLKSMLLYEEAARQFESALQLTPDRLQIISPSYLEVLLYLGRYEQAEELCREYLAPIYPMKPIRRLIWQIALIHILLLRNNTSAAQKEIEVIATNRPQSRLKVVNILPKKYRRMLMLSAESIAEIQALFDRYLPNVEASINTQSSKVPDEVLDDAEASANTISNGVTVILSSEADKEDLISEEPSPSKLNVLVPQQTIEATLKQLRDSDPGAIPEYLNGIIRRSVWNTYAYLEYAKYLEEQGKYVEAEDYLIAAIVYRNPILFRAPLEYACFLAKHGRVEEARNYFQHTLATPNLPPKQFAVRASSYVLALVASNNSQEAITICEQYATPFSDEQWKEVVDTLMDGGRYEDLERFARTQLAIIPGTHRREVVAVLTIALVRQGRYQETLPYHKMILKETPTPGAKQIRATIECAIYLIRQHSLSGNTSQFIRFAIKHTPDDPYTLSAQVEHLLLTRKFTEASQVIDRLLSANPHFELAHALHGQLLSWQGNMLQAYSAFERAANSQKQNPEALAKYCNFLTEQSRLLLNVDSYEGTILLNLALEQGEIAYRLEPTNPYVCNNYAYPLRIAGELEHADVIVQQMLKRCPNDVFTLIDAGKIKAALGFSSEAINYHEVAISVAPPSHLARAHGALGKLLLSLGDQKGAYKHLQEALKRSHSGAGTTFDMAEWHIATGRSDSAEALLRQVTARTPGFFQARLKLADLFVTMGKTTQAIVTYAELAVECWEAGHLLAAIRTGHMELQLLSSSLEDKLQTIAVATGLLAGRAACLNPYTQHTANLILQNVTNWLTDHPKTKELLEAQVNDLTILLQPSRIAVINEPLTSNPETLLIQFLRSLLTL